MATESTYSFYHIDNPCAKPDAAWRVVAAAIAFNVCAAPQVFAQTNDALTQLPAVVVNANRSDRQTASDSMLLGDGSLSATPAAITVTDGRTIEAIGAKRLADLNKLDASVSDAYAVVGYWDYATVRGFVINNQYNYRREGLPINSETSIALDNKASVELLKGISGLQAGTSAPGGLINYVVKRPPVGATPARSVRLDYNSDGSAGVALDLSDRLGETKAVGYRLNASLDRLDSAAPNTLGRRELLALAGDWRVNADSLLHIELEHSYRSQNSVPGLSLLGTELPKPNPKLNLNAQPWTKPVVMNGLTGTVKFEQSLTLLGNDDWRWFAQAGSQKLKSLDRAAFPFGCYKENNYDRYCSDGTFDAYDYRSENERRNTSSAQLQLKGSVEFAAVKHQLGFGVLNSQFKGRFQPSAYNAVGEGNVYAATLLPADPSLTYPNTNRSERSTELFASDMTQWNDVFTSWAGVRLSHIKRDSVLTDGNEAAQYSQRFATPWLAASYKVATNTMVYASYGQGLESTVVPNQPKFSNAGRPLPALKSTQYELGLKAQTAEWQWTAAAFDISRPMTADAGDCSIDAGCTRQIDGKARHRGLELTAGTLKSSAFSPWQLDGGLSVIQAKREGAAINPEQNGLRPTNVPRWIARINVSYTPVSMRELTLFAHGSYEAKRAILADNSLFLPAWKRLDAGLRYDTKQWVNPVNWTLAIDNVLNTRYFSESPNQFGHVYLVSAKPRTLRLSATMSF